MYELKDMLIGNALDTYSTMWKMKNEVQEEERELNRLMIVLAGSTAMLMGFSERAATDDFINEQIRIILNDPDLSKDEKLDKLNGLYEGLKPERR